jgi:hypothetical protein
MARVKKYKLGDCVLIDWYDAARRDGWESAGERIGHAQIYSVGFVHVMPEDDDRHITISGDVDIEDGANGRKIKIPMGCVNNVIILKIPER